MKNKSSVNIGNLLLSFSDAIDLAVPVLVQHQQRAAFIAWELGKVSDFSADVLENIFIAALLHDIGALSIEEKTALCGAEEAVDREPHCIRGERLLETVPLLAPAAEIVRYHHKEWQEWEDASLDNPVVLGSQIILLAEYLDKIVDRDGYILHQEQHIATELSAMSGTVFHPQIVDHFLFAANREEFWFDYVAPRLYSLLLHNGPFRKLEVDLLEISPFAELFRNIIDFKSRFTVTHSSGVAACGKLLSELFGFSEVEVQQVKLAGDLHDIGKLVIKNSILNKPGPLTANEFALMKAHPYFTFSVLNTIEGLDQIVEWASFHHENLKGTGYPFHYKDDLLTTGSRIITVADIFTALSEDRPYRKKMTKNGIEKILKDMSREKQMVDTKIVNLLLENYDQISAYVMEKQAQAMDFYEQQFAAYADI